MGITVLCIGRQQVKLLRQHLKKLLRPHTFLEERLIGRVVAEEVEHEDEAVLHHHATIGKAFAADNLKDVVVTILKRHDLLKVCVAFGQLSQK